MNEVNGQKKVRDSKGRFVKGSVPNPTGRPKTDKTIKDLLSHLVPKSVELMEQMLNDPTVGSKDKIKIIEIILDRVYGRPWQAVDVGLDKEITVTFADSAIKEYGK